MLRRIRFPTLTLRRPVRIGFATRTFGWRAIPACVDVRTRLALCKSCVRPAFLRGLATASSSSSSRQVPQFHEHLNPHTVLSFTHRNTDYYIVGTAHISKKSADEVADVIEKVKPDAIMVELDPQRAARLQENDKKRTSLSLLSRIGLGMSGMGEIGELFKSFMAGSSGDLFGGFLRMMYRFLESKGFKPGAEFIVAMNEAQRRNLPLVYGDQQSSETMKQIGRSISLPKLLSLLTNPEYLQKMATIERVLTQSVARYNARHPEEALNIPRDTTTRDVTLSGGKPQPNPMTLGIDSIVLIAEAMKDRETARELFGIFKQQFPEVYQALVSERDKVMFEALQDMAADEGQSGTRGRPRRVVVGVVGFGHLDGIENYYRVAEGETQIGSNERLKLTSSDSPLPKVIHL